MLPVKHTLKEFETMALFQKSQYSHISLNHSQSSKLQTKEKPLTGLFQAKVKAYSVVFK